jgi:hypothetical protein
MNNPIRFIDPDGMVVDDFYFDKDGKLLKYVENDKPDRVFIATDKSKINSNEEYPMPEPVYDQVAMASSEIEKNMNDNGYKKVIEEETVEVTEMTTYYTDSDGGNTETSKSKTDNKILDQETMFVTNNKSVQETEVKYLGNLERIHNGSFLIEKNIEKRTYDYDKKPDPLKNENVNKTVQFIFKLIQSIL